MKSLVWFRSDLRLHDNPALKKASIVSNEIHAVYVYSKEQLRAHNEANVKVDFLIKNLFSLEEKLNDLNIPLTIVKGSGFEGDSELILRIAKEREIEKVFCNSEFGEDETNRDHQTLKVLKDSEIEFQSFHDKVIYTPGSLRTGQDKPYSVFTPFKRKWIENFDMEFLDIDFNYTAKVSTNISSNIKSFDFDFNQTHQVDMTNWKEGEEEANKKLELFLNNKSKDYSKNRNDPIIEGTSRLSPYLALGIISPKRCILEALKKNNFELDSGEKGVTKWIDEIVWREFYKNIMFSFSRVSKGKPFQEYTNKIKWRFNKEEYEAWKNGKTGFPLIDAAMRQLKTEGWMHNRLRMVVAMFFTKNMLHDWRLGEAFFMQNLIDGDFSSNNGGWQWSSSTGTDAAPYFRIFNPLTQSKNFDSDGLFIKKYVNELKDVEKKDIHDPSNEIRSLCNYPNQMLDLKESRLRAIDAFNEAKN